MRTRLIQTSRIHCIEYMDKKIADTTVIIVDQVICPLFPAVSLITCLKMEGDIIVTRKDVGNQDYTQYNWLTAWEGYNLPNDEVRSAALYLSTGSDAI